MNSYRRGLRDGALVTLKLFLLEKVKLGQLGQTWSKLVFSWYGSLQPTPLKEKFHPRNSHLCHGKDEGTGPAFGPPVPKSPLRLGGFSTGLSLRILSCCEAPSLPYPESALAVSHRISHPAAQSLVPPAHVRGLRYTRVASRCGKHYGLEQAPPESLIYRPLDLSYQQSKKVRCNKDLASLASQNVSRPSKERALRILDLQPQTQGPFYACLHSSFAYSEMLSTWHV